ncbi:MAG: DNA mismatch repair endonuclease MutL [Clostridiales bacterium]|nr:DNA mismatch repair endonuclease MutL [Clostridiales bacterium]
MGEIHILDNNLINKIAAGEVVERPSSVVKELVENSIDAGATKVTIEISGGGVDFIKITDNGKGIPKEQVKTAFERHATSKINDFDDLLDILTLGFRGEALSSICSVSQMEIITRTENESAGVKMKLSAGEIISGSETGSPVGTEITVKNLFYNTPARRKFLKKASVESGYINDVIARIALGHPNIAFKYINNKSAVIQTLGSGDIKTCAFSVYGKEISSKTIYVSYERNGYRISGLIGMPEISRANRTYENFFINGRFIKSKIVSGAAEDAYKGKLMAGRFPVFILNMTVPSNTVDINVHPTKLEARFSDEDFIYEFVYDTVYEGLKKEILIPGVKVKAKDMEKNILNGGSDFDNPTETLLETEDRTTNGKDVKNEQAYDKILFPKDRLEIAEELKSELLIIEDKSSENSNNKENFEYNNINENDKNNLIDYTRVNMSGVIAVGECDINTEISQKPDEIYNITENINLNSVYEAKEEKRERFFDNYRIAGQIFKTYWIVEQGECIYMIDQHAAHERLIYEEFTEKFKNNSVLSQRLIQPVAVNLNERETAVLNENKKLIEDFGFEIEEFGKNTYAVRSVPYIFKNPENAAFFKDIIDMLCERTIESVYDTKADAIATMACKAAVKGNNKLDYSEARALIEKIVSLENPFNCPHGRPTIVKMTKYDVEKFFKRVL